MPRTSGNRKYRDYTADVLKKCLNNILAKKLSNRQLAKCMVFLDYYTDKIELLSSEENWSSNFFRLLRKNTLHNI